MSLESMEDLLLDHLRSLYHAEKQFVAALPKLIVHTTCMPLRQTLADHLEETERQVARLERVFETLEHTPRGGRCRAAEGLIEDANEATRRSTRGAVMDAAIIAGVQRIEHLEIASYGCVIAFARLLGLAPISSVLTESLIEEKNLNDTLTRIAEEEVNEQAVTAGAAHR
jgi:ferritin-like metal-binding protein YciE